MTDHTSNLIDRDTLREMTPWDIQILVEDRPRRISDPDLEYLMTWACEEMADLGEALDEIDERDPCELPLLTLERRQSIISKIKDFEKLIVTLVAELQDRQKHGSYWFHGSLRTY